MPDVSRRGFLSKSLKTVAAATLIPVANKLKPPLVISESKRISNMASECPASGSIYIDEYMDYYRMSNK